MACEIHGRSESPSEFPDASLRFYAPAAGRSGSDRREVGRSSSNNIPARISPAPSIARGPSRSRKNSSEVSHANTGSSVKISADCDAGNLRFAHSSTTLYVCYYSFRLSFPKGICVFCPRHYFPGASYTVSPPITVRNTFVCKISCGEAFVMSRSSTTMSARKPGSNIPLLFSSNSANAEACVYA